MGNIKDEYYLSDDILTDFLININDVENLSEEEINDLVNKSKLGDKESLNLLINRYTKLIISIAKKHSKKIQNMELIDLIHEGIIGFIQAVKRFDKNLGKLSSYAVYWINQAICGAINDKEFLIRRANKFIAISNKYYKLVNECVRDSIKIPSDDELCKILNVSMETLYLIKTSNNLLPLSINEPVDDCGELENFIISKNEDYDKILSDFDNQRLLAVIKETLSPIQYYVIYYHIICPEKKLDDFSKELGMTIERIRQIEKRALRIIKPYMIEDSFIFNNVAQKFKKDKIKIEDINILPIRPSDIAKYLYIKDELTVDERKILYLKLFGKYKYTKKLAITHLGYTADKLKLIEESLKNKINIKFADLNMFNSYFVFMIKTYKTNIFDLISHSLGNELKTESLIKSDAENDEILMRK